MNSLPTIALFLPVPNHKRLCAIVAFIVGIVAMGQSFFIYNVQAQVKIKERVQITPVENPLFSSRQVRQVISGSSWSTGASGKITVQWDSGPSVLYMESPTSLAMTKGTHGGHGITDLSYPTGTNVSLYYISDYPGREGEIIRAFRINDYTFSADFIFPQPYDSNSELFRAFVSSVNERPVFQSVTHEPPGPDYMVHDSVRITAHFSDPDNDAVIMRYNGDTAQTKTVILDMIGNNVVYIEGMDEWGGHAEFYDTLKAGCEPTDIVLYFACPDNICHGAVQEIGIGLQDTSLCPRPPSEYENTPVTVSIQRGSKYGELVIPGTGVRGLQVQGRYLYFDANGENVLTPDTITLRAVSADSTIRSVEKNIRIAPSPVAVMIEPSKISAGDTADIIVKKRNADGTLSDYPADVEFEIGLLSGCMNGEILLGGERDILFNYAYQPFKFIASSTVGDSTNRKIRIRVGKDRESGGGGGTTASMRPNASNAPSDEKRQHRPPGRDEKSGLPSRNGASIAEVLYLNGCDVYPLQYFRRSYNYGVGEVEIGDTLPDHLEVRLERDTIAFTETSKITVQAKDANNQDVAFDGNALIKLTIPVNGMYGTFISKNGDTLKTTPVVLDSVRYDDARGGLVQLAAVKKNPDSVASCTIRAELKKDASKKGEKAAIVVEQTLKIVMEQPCEVRPSIPTEDRIPAMVRLRKKPFEV